MSMRNHDLVSHTNGEPLSDEAELSGEQPVPSHYVHPQSRAFFGKCGWFRHVPIVGDATECYGPSMTLSMGVVYFLNKGIANNLESYANYAMFTDRYGLDTMRYQRLSTIGSMGWSIKAFVAMLCDAFAFMGYTKRWYLFAAGIISGAFSLGWAVLPAKESSANSACAFVFLASFGRAAVDILMEGLYSRRMRKESWAGPQLVSWVWWMIMIGALIAAGVQGPLSDASIPQVGVYVAAACELLSAVPFLWNCLQERPNREERIEDVRLEREDRMRLLGEVQGDAAPSKVVADADANSETRQGDDDQSDDMELATGITVVDDNKVIDDEADVPAITTCLCGTIEFNKDVVLRNWRIFIYSIVITCAVITMTCANILADTIGLLIICIVVSVVCCLVSFWALPMLISKVNIFGYLQCLLYLSITSAVNGFYLADEVCLPDGPHFTYTFYNTVASLIGNVGGLAGVVAFPYIFSKYSYRVTVALTTFIMILASIFDLIIVERWNVYIGIPDHAMYILGDAVVYQVVYYLAWMPTIVVISHVCPRGSESMVYAILAGFSNLGSSLAGSLGSIIMEYWWPVSNSVPCDFTNLRWLLIVGHMLLPLLIIPSSLLLPSTRICDKIDIEGNLIRKEQLDRRDNTAESTAEPIYHSDDERRQE